MSCTSRTINDAYEKAAKFEKSIQPETLLDMQYDNEQARSIMMSCYAMGYMDAKKLSGKWNNPIPTIEDFKAMFKTWWKWLCNIPPYALSRCHKIGNRRIVVFIKRDMASLQAEVLGCSNMKLSRNGWRMYLSWMMTDKYLDRGLIRSFKVVNNDPKADGCIWIDEQGLDGYLEVHLRNCNEVVKIEYHVEPDEKI